MNSRRTPRSLSHSSAFAELRLAPLSCPDSDSSIVPNLPACRRAVRSSRTYCLNLHSSHHHRHLPESFIRVELPCMEAYWAVQCKADINRNGKVQRCDTPLRLKHIHECDPTSVDSVLMGRKLTFEHRCRDCQQVRTYTRDDLGIILSNV